MTHDPKLISLALGGGGARGVAHLGVIEELLAAGYRFERIVGVSIGSLAGSLYAFDPDIHRTQERIVEYLESPGFQRFQRRINASQGSPPESESNDVDHPSADSVATEDSDATSDKTDPVNTVGDVDETGTGVVEPACSADDAEQRPSRWSRMKRFIRMSVLCQQAVIRASILPGDLLCHAVEHLLPDADIADAAIPLSIVAVDLLSGQRVIMDRGPLRDAVRGSSSIPGIFPPVEREGQLLCDIGVLNSLPTHAAHTDEDTRVIAVDVSSELKPLARCESAVDVLVRMNNVGESLFRGHMSEVADFVIRPEVGDVEWFDFSNPKRLIELGREAARETLRLNALHPCN